jgi:REP element-mobilizing transposase RayT
MSRPLRIEFPGAVYYVSARGNAGASLFTGMEDGQRFLDLLQREIEQQRWLCHGYCLMEDHFHLLLETPEPNLGRGMARLSMAYSQWFGRHHNRHGHLFQGRYKAIILEKSQWLQPLARHMALNPVRVGAVNRADQWRWSSYRAFAGSEAAPSWLECNSILSGLDSNWADYVEEGIDAPSPWEHLRAGHYLGGEPFLKSLAERIKDMPEDQVTASARHPARPTADMVRDAVATEAGVSSDQLLDRSTAPDAFQVTMYLLRRAANLPLKQVAEMGSVSPGRISQIQRAIEDQGGLAKAHPWAAPLEALLG